MLRKLVYFGFFLRVMIAAWNGFFGPSFGADMDALTFHLEAVDYSRNLHLDEFSIGWIYSYVLGVVYFITTDSLFIGSLLSCFAWLISANFLRGSIKLLSISNSNAVKVMLIYAFLPSSLLFTAVTLREPYQLMFVNIALYSALKIYLHHSLKHWILIIFAVVGMGILHGALFAFGFILVICLLVLISLKGSAGMSMMKILLIAPIVFIILFYGFSLFSNLSYNLEGGMGSAVEAFQQGGLNAEGRTNYKDSVEISGAFGLIAFVPISVFQYLFEPMPWKISALFDIAVLMENFLRAWLLWRVVCGLRKTPSESRRILLFLFILYMILETIWSLGTINWGTAMRHHLPSMGILVLAAFFSSDFETKKNLKESHLRFGFHEDCSYYCGAGRGWCGVDVEAIG